MYEHNLNCGCVENMKTEQKLPTDSSTTITRFLNDRIMNKKLNPIQHKGGGGKNAFAHIIGLIAHKRT